MDFGVHVLDNATVTLECIHLFKLECALDVFPEVELLDHSVALFLIFKGTSILFSIVAMPVKLVRFLNVV